MLNSIPLSKARANTVQFVGFGLFLLLAASTIALFDANRRAIANNPVALSESIEKRCRDALGQEDLPRVERILSGLRKQNPSIKSIVVRNVKAEIVAGSKEYESRKSNVETTNSSPTQMSISIRSNDSRGEVVEIDFEPTRSSVWDHLTKSAALILGLYFATIGGAAHYGYARQLLARQTMNAFAHVIQQNDVPPTRLLKGASDGENIISDNVDFDKSLAQFLPDDATRPAIQYEFHRPHDVKQSSSAKHGPAIDKFDAKPIEWNQHGPSDRLRTLSEEQLPIPYSAISGLLAALAFRDLRTAEHSRRVAELCAAVAEGRMTPAEGFVLETAALLHDIGKIGVPDHVLLKPAPLTDDEWRLMKTHDQIGVEIIRASFGSEQLSHIIETHHAYFGGGSREESLPTGYDIPLGARILTIADAYDAMVTDRIYRKGCSPEEAFAELRRCATSQFDPELVERFIEVVQERIDRGLGTSASLDLEGMQAIGRQLDRIAASLDQSEFQILESLAAQLTAICVRYNLREHSLEALKFEATIQSKNVLAIIDSTNSLLTKYGRTTAFHPNPSRSSLNTADRS